MTDYRKLYALLFNAVTDALADLEQLNIGAAKVRLIAAQQQAEELYMNDADDSSAHK